MSCEICFGSGVIPTDDDGFKKCKCVVTKEVLAFCAEFKHFTFSDKYATKNLNKDYVFESVPYDTFGGIVKSFLSYLFIKDNNTTWRSISGTDLIDITFERDETHLRQNLVDLDFLIVKLGRDSQNRCLGEWVLSLLTARKERGKISWVYKYHSNMKSFLDMYGHDLISYINDKNNFKALSKR